jgi:2-oxoglutarate ferredoxin oxidoreductase subunit gamma
MYYDLICAGFGGQGVLVIGNLVAEAALQEGKNATFFPSYGVEMRGGTANCTVVISDEPIGSPIIGHPLSSIVMNLPSLVKFAPLIRPDGLLLVNSSLVDPKEVKRNDIELVAIPFLKVAGELGNDRLANMVAVGAYCERTGTVSLESIFEAMKEVFDEHYHHLIPKNIEAVKRGSEIAKNS